MKLEKAIKELELFNSATFETRFITFSEARELGIEAMKRIRNQRKFKLTAHLKLLPGETDE